MQAVKNGSVFEKVVGVNGEKFLMPGIPLFIKRLFRLKKQKIPLREVDSSLLPKCRSFL